MLTGLQDHFVLMIYVGRKCMNFTITICYKYSNIHTMLRTVSYTVEARDANKGMQFTLHIHD